ncbi:MAG TPA: choice-of-anchor D domain-containing protein [Terriglobia bacterium]|nr:choice-of-anchor D domain-containing protein [Terriglobia bacterium]
MQVGQARRPGRLVPGGTVSVLVSAFYLCFLQALPAQGLAAQDTGRTPTSATVLASARPRLAAAYSRLPLSFEVNRGQAPAPVRFLARGAGYTLFLAPDGATLVLSDEPQGVRRSAFSMGLAGADPRVSIAGVDKLPGESNYFLSNDPKAWQTHVPTFGRVAYHNVYPGVDLVYYGHSGQLEYDFVIAPGADLSRIHLALDAKPRLTADGDLALPLGSSEVRFHKPVVYQTGPDGSRHSLAGGYVIVSESRSAAKKSVVGFRVAGYDHTRPLVIDPTFTYATYLGGTGTDSALGIAVDSTGNVYVTGRTTSTDFPVKGPYQSTFNGSLDAFVTKISADGLSIVYSTYLGGSKPDTTSTSAADSLCGISAGVTTATTVGAAIAVDSSGDAYVTGNTNASDFPFTTGAKQFAIGGNFDAFVTKLNTDGASLSYSTFTGGSQDDCGTAIAVDTAGEVYVGGSTSSKNFVATKSAYQVNLNSSTGNAFFMELNSSASAPAVYTTFLGGTGSDVAQGIALDPACTTTDCSAYLTGQTTSLDFPVSATAYQKTLGGGTDAFVTEINPALSGAGSLVYSTFLGGAGNDLGYGIAVDSSGNAYVAGSTTSSAFPVTSGAYQTALKGSEDAFAAKLDAGGSTLSYSTYLGGSGVDSAAAIAIDSTGDAFVTGNTQSTDFPVLEPAQAICATTSGALCDDAFVTSLGSDGAFLNFSSYLGGGLHDAGNAIAVDASANVYVAGATLSTDFPATPGVFQTACATSSTGACGNAFIAEIGPAAPAVQLSPQVIPFGAEPLGVPSTAQTITVTNNSGSAVTFSSIATTGNYQVAVSGTTCFTSTPLSFGSSCAVALTFTPNVVGDSGANQGTLVLTDNASGSPTQTALLKGTGVTSLVALSPGSLTFSSQFVGTTSAPQDVTLVNSGTSTLSITSVSVTAGSGFAQTNNCGTSVAAGSSCTITVTFSPTASGTASGTLSVTDNATGSPQTVNLTGTGASPAVSLSAATLNFGSQVVNTGSTTPQSVTLTNSGNASLSITAISIAATTNPSPFTLAKNNPCGSTIAQGGSCTIQVNFKPTSSGSQSATLSITDNAPNSPQTVTLNGSGSDFQLSVSPGSQSVSPGQTTTYTMSVSPLGGFSGNVGLTCKGQPINTSCTMSLTSVNVSGTSAVNATVTVVTSAPSAAPPGIGRYLRPGDPPRLPWPVWLALGGLVGLLSLVRRKARPYVLAAAMLVMVSLWIGCGNSLTAPPTVAAGTPAGNYTLTLSGTSGDLGHTVTTTLVVN